MHYQQVEKQLQLLIFWGALPSCQMGNVTEQQYQTRNKG